MLYLLSLSLSDWPCEVQHNQVSCSAVWKPCGRASAVLSKMHRYDVRHLLIQTPGVRVFVCLVTFCPVCPPPPHSSSDEPRIPAGLRASVKSCRYNGTIYQPGETFNKHDLFPSKQSNQCVMCTCSVSYIAFTSSVFVRPGLLFYGSGERISHSETDSLWSYRGDVGLQWAMKPEGYRSLEILCVCMDTVKQGCWGGCSIPLNRGIIKAISR